MGTAAVKNIVKQTLAQCLAISAEQIGDQEELYEGLGIDSSSIVSLLLDLEQACEVEFDLEALQPEHLSTVDSLAAYISELQANQYEEEGQR